MKLGDYYPTGKWIEMVKLDQGGAKVPFRARVVSVDEKKQTVKLVTENGQVLILGRDN